MASPTQTRPKQSPFEQSIVGTTTRISIDQLNCYHENPHEGDVSEIAGSLKANGQYKPITVNVGTFTGRRNEVLAGNHTMLAFRELAAKHPDDPRWFDMLVHWVDVDDDRAARIVAVDNRTAELGRNDPAKLAKLLGGLSDLTGTGYATSDLNDLVSALNDAVIDPNNPGGDGNGNGPDSGEPLYSDKVDVPHYVPSDTPPTLAELIDTTHAEKLLREIADADIPDDVRQVLALAAYRHVRINFHRMADYYASAPADVQQLMENQALVIIDIENAIRQGYVRLTDQLRNTLKLDRADGVEELGEDDAA